MKSNRLHSISAERQFKCTNEKCGFITTAYKSKSRSTSVGHIKTMYCPRCEAVSDFVQIKYHKTLADVYDEFEETAKINGLIKHSNAVMCRV